MEWTDRIGRLNSAINAEVDDLMDIIECDRDGGPHVEIGWVADGLIVLGEHLREAAADMLDVGSAARKMCEEVQEDPVGESIRKAEIHRGERKRNPAHDPQS